MNIRLNCLYLISGNPVRLKEFYEKLGLKFTTIKHKVGFDIYRSELGSVLFEIYPNASAMVDVISNKKIDIMNNPPVRFSFDVDNLEEITKLVPSENFINDGFYDHDRVFIIDPDGNEFMLHQKNKGKISD